MTARNNITGDLITTKGTTDAYRENYDRIFGKKRQQLMADTGPEKTEEDRRREELCEQEERRSGIWFEDANR